MNTSDNIPQNVVADTMAALEPNTVANKQKNQAILAPWLFQVTNPYVANEMLIEIRKKSR